MRDVGGLLAFHLLVLAPGIAFLLATGLTALRPRDLLASVGLAHLVGVAATSLVAIVLLVAGGSLTLPVFAAISLLLTGAFLAVALLRRRFAWTPYAPLPPEPAPERNLLA